MAMHHRLTSKPPKSITKSKTHKNPLHKTLKNHKKENQLLMPFKLSQLITPRKRIVHQNYNYLFTPIIWPLFPKCPNYYNNYYYYPTSQKTTMNHSPWTLSSLLLPRSQTHAAAVLGVHGGETDMEIYCTFQLSSGYRPSDSAGCDADLTCR